MNPKPCFEIKDNFYLEVKTDCIILKQGLNNYYFTFLALGNLGAIIFFLLSFNSKYPSNQFYYAIFALVVIFVLDYFAFQLKKTVSINIASNKVLKHIEFRNNPINSLTQEWTLNSNTITFIHECKDDDFNLYIKLDNRKIFRFYDEKITDGLIFYLKEADAPFKYHKVKL